MATELERLHVVIEANVKQYSGAMALLGRVTRQAVEGASVALGRLDADLERTAKQANSQMGLFAKHVVGPLAAALSVKEIIGYAESWKEAGNQLRVAGVAGDRQAEVMERLYQLAQKNAAPLNATVELFSRATQAADNLGASERQILAATDAVGLSLKVAGKGAGEAGGALLQLSQLLSGNKVQAQEYNSLIDGMYPLLQAVASGSDRWGGSVGKLSADVKDATVTTREFFQALLKGLPALQTRASAAVGTLDQAFTKINNALTRYIGQTDSSLGATQRLVSGLNAFADDFDNIADTALKLAAVVSGALVGRALGGLAIKIPIAIVAFRALSLAAAASSGAATFLATRFASAGLAIAGAAAASSLFRTAALAYAAGPIGLAIGATVTALIAFSDHTTSAATDAQSMRDIVDQLAAAQQRLTTETGLAAEQLWKQSAALKANADALVETARARLLAARANLEASTYFGSEGPPVDAGVNEAKLAQAEAALQEFVARVRERTRMDIPVELDLASLEKLKAHFESVLATLKAAAADPIQITVVQTRIDEVQSQINERTAEDAKNRPPVVDIPLPDRKPEKFGKQSGTGGGGSSRDDFQETLKDLERQRELIGLGAREQAQLNAEQRAGSSLTAAQTAHVRALAGALYDAQQAQERLNQAAEYFGQAGFDAFDRLALKGEELSSVLRDLVMDLARAVAQAALLGQGPLGGFGIQGQGGGPGGLFGALLGGLFSVGGGKAGGGAVLPGTVYPVGEKGREYFMPREPGQILTEHHFERLRSVAEGREREFDGHGFIPPAGMDRPIRSGPGASIDERIIRLRRVIDDAAPANRRPLQAPALETFGRIRPENAPSLARLGRVIENSAGGDIQGQPAEIPRRRTEEIHRETEHRTSGPLDALVRQMETVRPQNEARLAPLDDRITAGAPKQLVPLRRAVEQVSGSIESRALGKRLAPRIPPPSGPLDSLVRRIEEQRTESETRLAPLARQAERMTENAARLLAPLDRVRAGSARAMGGPIFPNMAHIVGEHGPELVLPKIPSVVVPMGRGAGQSERASQAPAPNITMPAITINLDARGADRQGINEAVARLKAEIPNIAVKSVNEAYSRKVLLK